MMTANQYSFRALQHWAKVFFPDTPLPCLYTLWYRVVHLPEARWHAFLIRLAVQGIVQERVQQAGTVPGRPPLVFVDGTGVGYNTPFYQSLCRRVQIQQIAAHIKGACFGEFASGGACGFSFARAC